MNEYKGGAIKIEIAHHGKSAGPISIEPMSKPIKRDSEIEIKINTALLFKEGL